MTHDNQIDSMDVVDREFARQHAPARGGYDDVERNMMRGLEHEPCEWHCADCGCCDRRPVGRGISVHYVDVGSVVIDEANDTRLCEDCTDTEPTTNGDPR